MTEPPQDVSHAAPEAGAQWVSVAEAATRLNTSPRSIQRQCQSGKLSARRVEGKRGEIWEVEAREIDQDGQKERDRSATTTATARQKSATTTATSATPKPSVALFSLDSRLKSATKERDSATNQGDDDSDSATKERDSDGDTGRSVALELQRTRGDLERERQERTRDAEQIQFLRAMVEGLQQSEAQTKAALREALKAMPKALTSGSAEATPTVSESPPARQNRADEQTRVALDNGPQIALETPATSAAGFDEDEIAALIHRVFR